jgi:hypothetical protein
MWNAPLSTPSTCGLANSIRGVDGLFVAQRELRKDHNGQIQSQGSALTLHHCIYDII